jgi:hypothetical protein
MGFDLVPLPQRSGRVLSRPFAYIVAFRFTGPPLAYEDFYKELKAQDNWFNYTPNLWIVLSRIVLVDLAANLRSKIRTGDWLMVMPAKGPVDGWLPTVAWEWLNNALPREW